MTTIDKAADVIRAVSALEPSGQLTALEQATGIPKPTLYRILRVLIQHDMVRQDSAGRYHIGSRMFSLAADAYVQFGVTSEVRRAIVDLGHHVGKAIHVSVFRADQLIYVDKLDADTPFQIRSEVGRFQAVHSSAIGRSVLAHLEPDHARRVLANHDLVAYTPYTVTDIDTIMNQLPGIKARGYAFDNEEDELSTRAVGAPILDSRGRPVGGISIVAPAFDTSLAELQDHAADLVQTVKTVQQQLAVG